MFNKLELTVIFGLCTILSVLSGAIVIYETEKVPADPSVQGVSTEVENNETPEPNIYEVYEKPDVNSDVIYFASEGEKLIVLDEKEGWYWIVLRDSRTGWISNTDISSRQVPE
jgi:hypothetical protein